MTDIVDRLLTQHERGVLDLPEDHVFVGWRDAAIEIDRLNAEIARLREALEDARNNGLIYWEPRTERGYASRAQMLSRIDAALAEQEKTND